MFDNPEFEIALHLAARFVSETGSEYDPEPDLLDTGLCVSMEEYEEPDFTGAGVPASLTFD